MAFITTLSLLSNESKALSLLVGDRPPVDEHETAKKVGKYIAAFLLVGGLLVLYTSSIQGMINEGPLAHLGFKSNLAIFATFGSIEVLTVLGLLLKKCESKGE